MLVAQLKDITLEQAIKVYEAYNMAFIIKDGKCKGFTKDK